MFNQFVLQTAGVGLAASVFLAAQPAKAQTASQSKEIEELKREIAELRREVNKLKQQAAPAPTSNVEGKTKTEVAYSGKSYVEKLVPDLGASKWNLSPAITELELYGDIRLRYEYRGGRTSADDPNDPNDWQERERERYRLRLGLRGTFLDDWFFGVRLETSASPRSTNVTFGDDTSSSSPGGGGPFAKGSDGIFVGQAYGGYKGFPGFTLTGGRMPNPFVYTRMVWDEDINPEGLAEQWKHTFTIGGEAAPVSYSKDGKDVAPPPSPEPLLKIDVFANFAQFVYDDSNPSNPIGPIPTVTQPIGGETQNVPTANAFMLGWQVGARFDVLKKFYFQLAPTLYNYTGDGNTFNIHFSGDPGGNQTGINSLLVFDMPMELGWMIGKIPMRIFGDFATNFDADDRATAAGHPDKGGQRYAYQAGFGIGQLKKKHDWQIEGYWQHQEQFSLDPNLVDNDLFNSQLNLQGVVIKVGYMLTDAVIFNVTYSYAWRINGSLGTGGVGDISINPLDQYQLFQANLNFNF
jgi:hypothetical protein